MDPCVHPELTQITGFLAGYGKGPVPQKDLYPILAMCSTPLHSDVLTVGQEYSESVCILIFALVQVAMEAFTEDVGNDPPWEEKTDSRLLWVSHPAYTYCELGVDRLCSEDLRPESCSPNIWHGVSEA